MCYFHVRITNGKYWNTVKNSKLSEAYFLTLLTLKRKEKWFLAWCVCACVYVCVYVCPSVCLSVRKSLSVDISRRSWPIWMKISVDVNLKTCKFDSVHFFDICSGFEIFRKKVVFWNSLSGARCLTNVVTWVEIRLKYLFYLGIEFPLDSTVGAIFSQNYGRGCFLRYFAPANCWRYQNKHGSIRSSSAIFFS